MEIQNNNYKHIPLVFNRNRSSDDLIKKEEEYKNNFKNNFIPYKKMEQYLNENHNYFYSTKNSELENSKSNMDNNNKQIINQKSNDIFNLPDDLLIEYNNRKRLDELRQKYLSNSSLHFLRKKDDIKKINPNLKKEEEKNNNEIKPDEKKTQSEINNNNNKEEYLKSIILEMKFKYDKLYQDFNVLMENKTVRENNENHLYKNYLIEENNELKNINNNYEIVLEMLISYINEANKILFNSPKIEYFNLKQNIWNKNINCLDELSNYLEKCKIKLSDNYLDKNIIKYNKINPKEKKIFSANKNILNKKNLFSNNNSFNIRNKNSTNNRFANSTISYRNKYFNNLDDSFEITKNKTLNKTKIDKTKKNLKYIFKKKNKK